MKAHFKALAAVLLVVIVALAAVMVIFRDRGEDADKVSERVVKTLPDLHLKTLQGASIDSKTFAGHPVIINFWASWCGPCVEEVPSLIRLSKAMKGDLQILAVSGDSSVDDINVFLKSFPDFQRDGISIVFDDDAALEKQFEVFKLPESFIFDAHGNMVRKVTGSIDWSNADAVEYMKHLNQ